MVWSSVPPESRSKLKYHKNPKNRRNKIKGREQTPDLFLFVAGIDDPGQIVQVIAPVPAIFQGSDVFLANLSPLFFGSNLPFASILITSPLIPILFPPVIIANPHIPVTATW